MAYTMCDRTCVGVPPPTHTHRHIQCVTDTQVYISAPPPSQTHRYTQRHIHTHTACCRHYHLPTMRAHTNEEQDQEGKTQKANTQSKSKNMGEGREGKPNTKWKVACAKQNNARQRTQKTQQEKAIMQKSASHRANMEKSRSWLGTRGLDWCCMVLHGGLAKTRKQGENRL